MSCCGLLWLNIDISLGTHRRSELYPGSFCFIMNQMSMSQFTFIDQPQWGSISSVWLVRIWPTHWVKFCQNQIWIKPLLIGKICIFKPGSSIYMFKCVNYSYFKDLESVQTVKDTYPKSVCFCQTQAQFVILNVWQRYGNDSCGDGSLSWIIKLIVFLTQPIT